MLGSERPPHPLRQHTGFLMNWCANRSRELFARRLGETGLHPREFGVLNVVASAPGKTQQAIGHAAGVDPATMTATLDGLERRGLVERRLDPDDRRRRAVHLTEEGKRLLGRGRRIAAASGDEIFAALTAEERAELHRLLVKLSGADDSS